MKILFVTHYSDMFGANTSLFYLIKTLKNKDIIPFVIMPLKGQLCDKLDEINVKYWIFPFYNWVHRQENFLNYILKRIIKETANIIAILFLCVMIKKNKIDIVHTNSSVVCVGAIASKLCGVKHIWHIREFSRQHFNLSHYWGFFKSMKIMNNCSEKVIVISKALYGEYSKYIDKNKLILIYNGVSKEEIRCLKKKKHNKVKLLLIGLLHENKGQKEAILAVNKLIKKGYSNIELNFAGDGPYKEDLKKIVEKQNIKKYVNFLGYVDNINFIMCNYNIGLMCSKYEAFGRVTVEYMLAKLPVIGANSGGTPELIIDKKTGLLYEPGNSNDLAKKIAYLIDNPRIAKEYGNNGYKRAVKEFSLEKTAQLICGVYREVMRDISNF